MNKKYLLWKRSVCTAFFVLLLSAAGMGKMYAQSFTVDNLNYSMNDDGASVTVTGHVDGTSATGELVIPESVEFYGTLYPVTAIGEYAFQSCYSLTGDLVIPNSVITIGNYAFSDCSGLNGSLTLGNSVQTIGYSAFDYCFSLNGSLTLGNSVQTIGGYAFRNCGFTGLLTIPENTTYIGGAAFENCNGFTSLNYNAINCYIEWGWLSNCTSLSTLSIGDNVHVIPKNFLKGRSIFTGELVIPNSVTSIGSSAFENCSGFTGSLNIPSSVTTIKNSAFNGCSGFTGSLIIGNSVSSIGENAFNGCSGFTGSLTIPNAVTIIGNSAFSNCSGFSGMLTLGAFLSEIGNNAFFGACGGFTSFSLQSAVPPTVGTNAFLSVNTEIPVYVPCGSSDAYQNASGWNVFTNIQETDLCQWVIAATAIPAIGGTVSGGGIFEQGQTCTLTATPIGDFEFYSWTENGLLVSTEAEYTFTVTGNRRLIAHFKTSNSINFADPNVEAVCVANWDFDGDGFLSYDEAAAVTDLSWTFYCNENINSFDELQYFTGLTTIYYAFYKCFNLTSIIIPEGVVTIGEYAFYSCGLRGELTLPESLELIGEYAFYGCDGISTVNYNAINCQTTNYADEYPVFSDCAFTLLNIGENVQSIPNFVFKRCFMITDMTVAAVNPPTIYPGTFGMVSRNIPVSVPHGSGDAYSNAPYWEEFFNIIEVYFNDMQVVPLSQGWNWWSTYLDITLEDLKAALVEALPGSNITIKSRTQNTAYNPNTNRWMGTLNSLDVTQMYMIYVSTDCEITLTGTPINPAEHPVTINNGSNWIAFPLSGNMSVSNAFAGFAVNGDKVKSRNNNSQYIGGSWRGQLTTLVPGQGYMYISNLQEPRTFTFPASTTKSTCLERKKDQEGE